ncbi:MAG: hypothetical protein HQ567_09960 [Candidatus Nealsonbacteria bacterium]|nr:hypothetical protein [Candidatus Nealsonbacteria bacterium]
MIDFLIDECRQDGGDQFVSGMLCAGTIVLGTEFVLASDTPTDSNEPDKEPRPVKLLVRGIMAYDHQLQELPQGMSGELLVEGEGAEAIRKGVFLRAHAGSG